MIIELDFPEIKKKTEKFDSETQKLQPVNFTGKHRDIVGVHQRAADSAKIIISLPFITTESLKCMDRVVNGLFHTKKVKMSRRSCK